MIRPLPMVWVNGRHQEWDAPHVSARDRGLTLADGVFETMRAQGGTIFKLEGHLARLDRALTALAIPAPPALREWLRAALDAAGSADVAVRLTVTRGPGATGLAPPAAVQPTAVIAVTAMPAFPPVVYERGLTSHIASGRRNERAMTSGLKTLAYTDAVAALVEAQRAGADEALFLDTEGHCSEATASNLFAWTGSVLLTPPTTCAALPGITRAAVLEIAAALDLETSERPFGPDELVGAREAFLTSSLRGIAPLVSVNGIAIGTGAPGALTSRITAAHAALVAEECGTGPGART